MKHYKQRLSQRYLDYTNNVKGALDNLQDAILKSQAYLAKKVNSLDPLVSASASKSSISATDPTPAQPLSLSADTLQNNNNIHYDLSGTSPGRTNKMGEGGNGPSHCPLPKVVVRSEDVPQLDPLQAELAIENYHNINSLGFAKRARAHLLRNLAKGSDNWENDDDSSRKDMNWLDTISPSVCTLSQSNFMKELSLSVNPQRDQRRWRNSPGIPQPSPPMAAVEPEEITESSSIKESQLVTRDDVVSQTILHYTTTSPSEKAIIINNQNKPINNIE